MRQNKRGEDDARGQEQASRGSALPRAWPSGSVRGLRARGGFDVDLAWSGGEIESVRLRSTHGGEAKLRYRGALRTVRVRPGRDVTLRRLQFPTPNNAN
ncbi:MAG TPA: hypothetical protein VG943_10775 [Caulobacterales bacterium]|nr:hypothetical protein [Caulobacterales bacterium]